MKSARTVPGIRPVLHSWCLSLSWRRVPFYSPCTGQHCWYSLRLPFTLHSRVNDLSSPAGNPSASGFKSRCRPSKPWVLRNLMEDWMKVWRLSGEDAMVENLQIHGNYQAFLRRSYVSVAFAWSHNNYSPYDNVVKGFLTHFPDTETHFWFLTPESGAILCCQPGYFQGREKQSKTECLPFSLSVSRWKSFIRKEKWKCSLRFFAALADRQ